MAINLSAALSLIGSIACFLLGLIFILFPGFVFGSGTVFASDKHTIEIIFGFLLFIPGIISLLDFFNKLKD